MVADNDTDKLRSIGLSVIALGVVLTGLVLGSSLLIPLAIAILLWNLLEALIDGAGRSRLPRWFAAILVLGVVSFVLYMIAVILLGQADAIAAAWPQYEERLKSIIDSWAKWLGPAQSAKVSGALAKIDVMSQVEGLFVSAQSFILSVALIILYVGFLFAESEYVGDKIAALFPAGEKARDVDRMLSAISGSIRRYIWIMSLVSALTSLLSYMVLHWIGVDFAETWALLIFFLNYIPNVGSVLGVAFPALLALVQFNTFEPFLGIALGLTTVHLIIGNVVKPMLMGHSLNMSSFADHSVSDVLGHDLGRYRHVSERADYGSDYDRLRECAQLALGGDLAVQRWSHQHRSGLSLP